MFASNVELFALLWFLALFIWLCDFLWPPVAEPAWMRESERFSFPRKETECGLDLLLVSNLGHQSSWSKLFQRQSHLLIFLPILTSWLGIPRIRYLLRAWMNYSYILKFLICVICVIFVCVHLFCSVLFCKCFNTSSIISFGSDSVSPANWVIVCNRNRMKRLSQIRLWFTQGGTRKSWTPIYVVLLRTQVCRDL